MACQKGVGGLFVVWRLYTADLYLALDRQPPYEVVQKLQKALNQLRAEGDLQAIGARY